MDRKRCLAIDDCREFGGCHMTVRTVKDGIDALKLMGPWDVLYLDHDMGALERQYTETGRELTGMDVLNFLEQFPEFTPKEIHIVTANASARPKMEALAITLVRNKWGTKS